VKKNELQGLRELSPEDLAKKEQELRDELFALMMRRGASRLENPRRLRHIRKDMARILTILREQGSRAAAPASAGGLDLDSPQGT